MGGGGGGHFEVGKACFQRGVGGGKAHFEVRKACFEGVGV